MIAAAVFGLALAGLAVLALSMHRHHRDVVGTAPSRRRVLSLRPAGWLLVVLSFAAAVAGEGRAAGPVLWLGLLTVAGLAVALALALERRWPWRAGRRPLTADRSQRLAGRRRGR